MSPIFLEFGGFIIRWYSILIILGVAAGIWLATKEAKRRGMNPDAIFDIGLIGVMVGIIGARLYFVAFNWSYFMQHPDEIFKIWQGGLAIHGALIATIGMAVVYCWMNKINFWTIADIAAPSLLLGQAIGRIGNLMNGDAHGIPTKSAFGMLFPENSVAGVDMLSRYGKVLPVHPTMLYESVWNIIGFAILWSLRKRIQQPGILFCIYLIYYSIGRAVIESFRADSLMVGSLRVAQIVSIATVLIAVGIMLYLKENQKDANPNEVAEEPVSNSSAS